MLHIVAVSRDIFTKNRPLNYKVDRSRMPIFGSKLKKVKGGRNERERDRWWYTGVSMV
jgi:hypothetical protein